MKENQQNFELIERYLNDQLGEQERIDFEEKLRLDQDFADIVNTQKLSNDIIVGNRLLQVKHLMDADFEKGRVENTGNKTWWFGGALTIVAISGILLYSYQFQPVSQDGKDTSIVKEENRTISMPSNDIGELYERSELPETEKIPQRKSVKNSPAIPDVDNGAKHVISDNTLNENIAVSLEKPLPKDTSIEKPVVRKETAPSIPVCLNVTIKGEVTHQPACTNKNDGAIQVLDNSIKGGQAPYRFILVRPDNDTLRQSESEFLNLNPGVYTVFIQDKNKCMGQPDLINVSERNCQKTKAHSFSPALGEVFNYPEHINEEATINIFDRYGVKVHQRRLIPGDSEFWNGTDLNGQTLAPASYIYIVDYKSGKKESGEILVY